MPTPIPVSGARILQVLAYGAIGAITVSLLLKLLVAVAEVAFYAALDDFQRHGSGGTLDLASTIVTVLAVVDVVWLVVAGGVFIAWLYRARLNLEAAGVAGFRWARGWVIGGWLVPFANFMIPYLVVSEVAAGSDPARPWWQPADQRRRDVLVAGWWAAWTASAVVVWLMLRFDSASGDTAEDMLAGRTVSLLLSGLGLGRPDSPHSSPHW